jgi:two-component system, LytTR family, response regulator
MKKKILSIVVIGSQRKMVWIRTEDVAYLESAGNYTLIYLMDGKEFTVCKSLKACCTLLDSSIIRRVCAHYAINLYQPREYIKKSRTLKFSESLSITIPEDKVAAFHSMVEDNYTVL